MTAAAPTRGPRLLGTVCVGLLVSAAALWGASVAVWYRVPVAVPAERVVDVTGAQVQPALGGVALLAVAGVAGVLAIGGVARRMVGVLLGVAGAAIVVVGASALVADPFAAAAGSLPLPPPGGTADALRNRPGETTPAPLLAVVGGLVLLAVGAVVLVRERRLPRFGARYSAARGRDGAARPPADPDRAAWQDLDAGLDPTDGPVAPTPGDDPDGGTRNRAG
ncbi:Trp biosynthesis-associated membrane protein [Pseudonocardia sp.]|uniref:Trp biosynthesis-associated membrane protein n=1 Tax=Pseudonocardia sp. TaxID=60912 RepID=UPI00260C5152|nr:Trp biosynthesis-associated membrane protein [Pseudonocardia sp.]